MCFAFADVADLSDGITFIYTARFVGDGWDQGEVERFKPPPLSDICH